MALIDRYDYRQRGDSSNGTSLFADGGSEKTDLKQQ